MQVYNKEQRIFEEYVVSKDVKVFIFEVMRFVEFEVTLPKAVNLRLFTNF